MTKLFRCDVCGIFYNLPPRVYCGGISLEHYSGSITRYTSEPYDDEVSSDELDLCQECQNDLDDIILDFVKNFVERTRAE